ncbi:hypothetical protein [Holophaga foetida]|uniref:hypothetical protein n=1 Tax=Holophaga foetida TaxID=35839 RepID=UPI0002475392|nr:hypothetical protein [Holophaga foetida]
MSRLKALALATSLPLAAQTWDLRLEVPFPKGQNLPQTMISGSGELVRGDLDTGHGLIFSASHRLIRVGPILKLEWGTEFSHWRADGQLLNGTELSSTQLRQTGLGLGLNAQFWLPFTGLAGELGAIERVQHYRFEAAGVKQTETLARPWLRVGLRYRLPLPLDPYIAASYQQPITKDHPVKLQSTGELQDYLKAQGSGQEFERMWTFGLGVMF